MNIVQHSKNLPRADSRKGMKMAQAQKGDRVRINFTGTLEDGTIFDSTLENDDCGSDCGPDCEPDACAPEHDGGSCGCGGHGVENGPMEITIGDGDFFPQVEEALVGMAPGETRKISISSVDAFGEYDEEKVFSVPLTDLPEGLSPEIGAEYVLSNETDETIGVRVIDVAEDKVVFDANHPLAGEDLTFEISLDEIL
jgi:peptidylprolyl isomerase